MAGMEEGAVERKVERKAVVVGVGVIRRRRVIIALVSVYIIYSLIRHSAKQPCSIRRRNIMQLDWRKTFR